MKKSYLILSMFITSTGFSQVVINEVQPSSNTIELKNTSASDVDVNGYFLCTFPSYQGLSGITVLAGEKVIKPGALLVVKLNYNLGITDGELGLYKTNSFGSSTAIVDYIEWGSTGHTRSSVGVGANTWSTGEFISGVDEALVIAYTGSGNIASSYSVNSTKSFGTENPSPTGVFKNETVAMISVYPNPVSESNLFVESEEITNYEIYNVSGELVLLGNYSSAGIDLNSLSKGVYTLKSIENSGKVETTRFVK